MTSYNFFVGNILHQRETSPINRGSASIHKKVGQVFPLLWDPATAGKPGLPLHLIGDVSL